MCFLFFGVILNNCSLFSFLFSYFFFLVPDVTLLGGRKIVTVIETRIGNAMLSGTFALAYEGERTTDISAVATAVQVRDALLGLTGLEANAVSVGRSLAANTAGGYRQSSDHHLASPCNSRAHHHHHRGSYTCSSIHSHALAPRTL